MSRRRFITAGDFVFALFCTNRRMKSGPGQITVQKSKFVNSAKFPIRPDPKDEANGPLVSCCPQLRPCVFAWFAFGGASCSRVCSRFRGLSSRHPIGWIVVEQPHLPCATFVCMPCIIHHLSSTELFWRGNLGRRAWCVLCCRTECSGGIGLYGHIQVGAQPICGRPSYT